jgi:hypothetical protein
MTALPKRVHDLDVAVERSLSHPNNPMRLEQRQAFGSASGDFGPRDGERLVAFSAEGAVGEAWRIRAVWHSSGPNGRRARTDLIVVDDEELFPILHRARAHQGEMIRKGRVRLR